MENEEKKSCCENKEKCEHCPHMCCHNWKKCHLIKKVIWIILIIVAFGLGSQWGEIKSELKSSRLERGGMMNWGYGQVSGKKLYSDKATGEVTVEVKAPTTTSTTTPSPKQ